MVGTLFSEIDVHTAATLVKAGDALVAKPVKVTDGWIAFKTHFDIGHTETEDLEDLVRGLGYASQIARKYGRALPIAAKMTDVPW